MKNLLKSLIVAGILATLFTGCIKKLPEQKFEEVNIEKKDDGGILFFSRGSSMFLGQYQSVARRIVELKEAANYGNFHKFKYFAVKGNEDFNNFYGTPITTISDLLKSTVQGFPEKHSVSYNKDLFYSKVYFFNEKPKLFPTWNIKDILVEKIDLSKLPTKEKYDIIEKKDLKKYFNLKNVPFIDN